MNITPICWFCPTWGRNDMRSLPLKETVAQCSSELVKPDLWKALSNILTERIPTYLVTHIFLWGWDVFTQLNRAQKTQVDPSQFDYTTAVSASECLLSGGKVEGGDLRREEQEDPPVSREERWQHWSAATQECRIVCTLAKGIHQFAYPSTKGITMGGTISQKKGSRRASSRSHTSSVMWVKFLTCWMLT